MNSAHSPEGSISGASADHAALVQICEAMALPERLTLHFDAHGVCDYASLALQERFGLALNEILGKSFATLHSAPGAPLARPDLPRYEEVCALTRDDIILTPLHAPFHGVLVHLAAPAMAVAEQMVHTLPEWEIILNHFPLGTVLVTYGGVIQFANDEARRITRQESSWRHIRECPHYVLKTPRGEQLEPRDHPMSRAIASGKDLINETLILYFEDGEVRRVECSAFHVQVSHAADAERVLLFLFRDVSARHQRAVEKGDLLSIASHELRNPLTPLKGLLHMIKQEYQQSGHIQTDLIHKAQNQVERLIKLVDGLLDLSIVETGKFSYSKKSHDVRELVDELVAGWCIRHGDERFELELPSSPLLINIDAAGIEQVLNNLLDNAIKHSPEERPILIQLHATEHDAVVTIQDHGQGFAMEHASELFERFKQGKNMTPRHGSLGLGLYVCKCIVEEHDGAIDITSAINTGTTVAVSLPLR